MDHFHEEVVIKRKNALNRIAYAVSWIVLIVSALLAVMSLSGIIGQSGFSLTALISTVVFGGIAAIIALFACAALVLRVRHILGGITGDVLGLACEVTQLVFLFVCVIFSSRGLV